MEKPAETSLRFVVEGLRMETRGLRSISHPELALEVADVGQLGAARAYLTALVTQVLVSGHRFAAGDELVEEGIALRLEIGTLELWEERGADVFGPGCPLLMSQLLGGS